MTSRLFWSGRTGTAGSRRTGLLSRENRGGLPNAWFEHVFWTRGEDRICSPHHILTSSSFSLIRPRAVLPCRMDYLGQSTKPLLGIGSRTTSVVGNLRAVSSTGNRPRAQAMESPLLRRNSLMSREIFNRSSSFFLLSSSFFLLLLPSSSVFFSLLLPSSSLFFPFLFPSCSFFSICSKDPPRRAVNSFVWNRCSRRNQEAVFQTRFHLKKLLHLHRPLAD